MLEFFPKDDIRSLFLCQYMALVNCRNEESKNDHCWNGVGVGGRKIENGIAGFK